MDEPVPARQVCLTGVMLEEIRLDSAKPSALWSQFYCKGLWGFTHLLSRCEQPG